MNEQFRAHYEAVVADRKLQKPVSTRRVVVLVCCALLGIALFVAGLTGLIFFVLNNQKDTAEYALCYDYLVSSDAFRQTEVSEEEIILNSYSSSTKKGGHLEAFTRTLEFGFLVDWRTSFRVVCHLEDGLWQVCRECTDFS